MKLFRSILLISFLVSVNSLTSFAEESTQAPPTASVIQVREQQEQPAPSFSDSELRDIFEYLKTYQGVVLANHEMFSYIQQMNQQVTQEKQLASDTLTAEQSKTAQAEKERDFYKSAWQAASHSGRGFWHKLKRIVTLGIAR
jgi:hypothetical protein